METQQAEKPSYQTFSYTKPELKRGKGIVQLAGSDIIRGRVQIVSEGGENNLHSHRGMDGFWFVLSGKVKFYGPGDVEIGEFGKHEGILVPRGAEYWFESSGAAPQKLDVDTVKIDVITNVR
jgi:mannose-6-phosphate isomerase-like protein (cupin superfamily)